MGKESRKAPRIDKLFVAKYQKGIGIWDISHIRNISEIGMQITTNVFLKTGALLRFRIIIPFEPFKWIELTGKVLNCSEVEYDFGKTETHVVRVEFVNLRQEQKELIEKYVEWFLNKNKKAAE